MFKIFGPDVTEGGMAERQTDEAEVTTQLVARQSQEDQELSTEIQEMLKVRRADHYENFYQKDQGKRDGVDISQYLDSIKGWQPNWEKKGLEDLTEPFTKEEIIHALITGIFSLFFFLLISVPALEGLIYGFDNIYIY